MSIIKWLEEWFQSNCNEDWEHGFGIKIDTLDNPGWSVDIDLNDVIDLNEIILEEKPFSKIKIDNGDDDWIFCWVEKSKFKGRADPYKLEKILEIFKEWVES